MDYTSVLLDEIALEGLDGITIEGLWLRLSCRSDFILQSQISNDSDVQEFMWNIVRRLRDVEFFQLKQPRKLLRIHHSYTVDLELGIITEMNPVSEDLYPHQLINDTTNGVIGSCSTYNTRTNVTLAARKLNLSDALAKYKNELVIVGNQFVRKNTLIGLNTNPNLDVSPIQFCILERIGRSRFHGEPTQGKLGLSVLGEDAKTIFYLRKYLLKHNLITKQVYKAKSSTGSSGLLLHLPRFYRLVKPRYIVLIEKVLRILADEPNHMIEYDKLREILKGVLKKLSKIVDFQKIFRADVKVPYRMMYPDAEIKQWKQKSCDKEKKVRVVTLRDPKSDIRELQKRLVINDDDDDDDDDRCGVLDEKKRFIDVPLLIQCCMLLKGRGIDGLTQTEIARELGLPKVQARTITKNLVKTGAGGMYMVDVGRQRSTKYYLKHDSVINDDHKVLFDNSFDKSICVAQFDETYTAGKRKGTQSKKDVDENCVLELNNSNKFSTDSEIDCLETSISNESSSNNDILKPTHTVNRKFTKRKADPIKGSLGNKKKKIKVQSDGNETKNNLKETFESKTVTDLTSAGISIMKNNKTTNNKKGDICNKDNDNATNTNIILFRNADDKMDVDETCQTVDSAVPSPSCSLNYDLKETNTKLKDVAGVTAKSVKPSAAKDIDSDKIQIDVTITDDLSWLLPGTCKNEIVKIQTKALKTIRLLKRSNLVMEAVHRLKVISDTQKLVTIINESEFNEGLSSRMDKKSLLRILFKLAMGNHIKVYRVTFKHGSRVMHLNFICDKNVNLDNSTIQSTIEFNKVKFHSMLTSRNPLPRPKQVPSVTLKKRNSFSHFPKFNRMKLLHKFLFSLVYEYMGVDSLKQDVAKSKIMRDVDLNENELKSLPKLYLSKIDEQMFVPALPKYSDDQGNQLSGWCFLSDVLVRMPLSIFLRLVQIPYFIPELDDYMNHPIKKYYLLNNLPSRIHNCLTSSRKYIFSVYEVLTKLVYIGLLQFGVQHKEKDQIFVYVNTNATLLDTTISKPGYNKISDDIEYPVHSYRFESMQNIDEYWHNCWKICMNTQLGGRSQVIGTDIVLVNVQDKQDMINAMKSHDFNEASNYDTGFVPGDKMGAAGFDSALFAHLKRNWVYKSKLAGPYDNVKVLPVRKLLNPTSSQTSHNNLNRLPKRKASENIVPVKQNALKSLVSIKDKSNVSAVPSNKQNRTKKPAVRIRRINPVKKSLHRKPYYDHIDKEALKRMSKLRVDWSPEEDRILLICKVASTFICPDTRKQVNANMFHAIREILHKSLHFAKNKTSRACQRRVAYMLRSDKMRHNVNLCIEELKQDEHIVEKYGNTLDLINQEAKQKGKRILDLAETMWKERFKSLVDHLMSRYDSNLTFSCFVGSGSNNDFLLPDSLQEFYKSYNLQCVEKKHCGPKDIFTPVSNVNDVYSAILNSTIHSTLSCNSDKTSWSYHLFSIYQQYPERILRNTLNRLRENHMVSFKRACVVRNKKSNNYYLPLSASPYQLSISYVNLIQTKYQSDMYLDCYNTYSELIKNFNPEMKMSSSDKGYEILSLNGGSAAAVVELYCNDVVDFAIEIPNQVIILDPNIEDKDETYTRLVQRYKDVLTTYKMDLTSSILFQKHNYHMSCNSDSNGNSNVDDEYVDGQGDYEKLCDNTKDDTNSENSRAMQNVAKAASRIALYLMNDNKDNPNGLIPKEMDHVYDFFVVNSCKIFVKLTQTFNYFMMDETNCSLMIENDSSCKIISENVIKETLKSVRDSAVFHNINTLNQDGLISDESAKDDEDDDWYRIKECNDVILHSIIESNFKNDVILVKSLLEAIKSKKELGLTSIELITLFDNSFKVVGIINKLIDLSFILHTGVVHSRYVYCSFTRPWLLHSYRNLRNNKDSRVPLHNLKCFKVKKNECFDEVCSDDDNVDGNDKDPDGSTKIGKMCETKTNCVEIHNTKCDMNGDKIDNNRWCIAKENLDKLTSCRMTEPIRVVVRPWIRVDGTLNRRVLDAMLSSVLSHIMLYPGASLSNIQFRFSPAYQPHHIREVCDILQRLNCVSRYCVKIKTKPSLFSKPCQVLVCESTGLESEDCIKYESSKFAIINLGKFLSTKPYVKDFIDCLIGK